MFSNVSCEMLSQLESRNMIPVLGSDGKASNAKLDATARTGTGRNNARHVNTRADILSGIVSSCYRVVFYCIVPSTLRKSRKRSGEGVVHAHMEATRDMNCGGRCNEWHTQAGSVNNTMTLVCSSVYNALLLLERQRSRYATWVLLREQNWPAEFRADRANICPLSRAIYARPPPPPSSPAVQRGSARHRSRWNLRFSDVTQQPDSQAWPREEAHCRQFSVCLSVVAE